MERDEFIFSARSYQYLGFLAQNVRDGGLPPGLIFRSIAQTQVTVVDHGPSLLTRKCHPSTCPRGSAFMPG